MSTIFGQLNLNDTDRVFASTQGQSVIYDAIQSYIARENQDMLSAYSVFINETTQAFKEKFKLPGGGYMQEIDHNQKPDAIKGYGSWDVAYPLKNYADAVSGSRVDRSYLTVAELSAQVVGVNMRSVNTMRREILRALLYKEDETFGDPLHGDLTIKALATGSTDGVLYPPLPGASAEAVRQRYNGSNYTAANISDTNNPYETISDALTADFGQQQGNSNVAVFINSAQKAKTKALTDFDEYTDKYVVAGANVNQLTNLPTGLPGIIIGRVSGCWVVQWDFMPSGYMLGVHLDSPAPLKRRVDPSDTGLGDGLQLVAEDANYPFISSYWQNRFGLGVGNRLNGYAMQLVASTTYTSPTIS